MEIIAACVLVAWLVVLLAPFRPWSTRERLEPWPSSDASLADVTVLVPARNEAAVIGHCLNGLAQQGGGLRVLVVDDESSDATATVVERHPLGAELVAGVAKPADWNGKLWALQQAVPRVDTPLTLLLDADIELGPGILVALRRKLHEEQLALVSIMATLSTATRWERLLMPAFVYFFKLLYPFRLSNSRFRWVAAAAGGCVLLRSEVLQRGRGLEQIHAELIDDCALARLTKREFGRTWIGLSDAVNSRRSFASYRQIAQMVSRTAYDQLQYSPTLLGLCTALMAALFAGPVIWLFSNSAHLAALALAAMFATYVPIVRFYRLPFAHVLTLPVVAVLYLSMTWQSAIAHWRGGGATWKARSYGDPTKPSGAGPATGVQEI